ncbi:hypothetical protein D0A39_00075 [Xanthomonas campestris pv. campestris]|nr:hypothetical protein D0A39_00075 [Xanthomonas campestris pv. campestris]
MPVDAVDCVLHCTMRVACRPWHERGGFARDTQRSSCVMRPVRSEALGVVRAALTAGKTDAESSELVTALSTAGESRSNRLLTSTPAVVFHGTGRTCMALKVTVATWC